MTARAFTLDTGQCHECFCKLICGVYTRPCNRMSTCGAALRTSGNELVVVRPDAVKPPVLQRISFALWYSSYGRIFYVLTGGRESADTYPYTTVPQGTTLLQLFQHLAVCTSAGSYVSPCHGRRNDPSFRRGDAQRCRQFSLITPVRKTTILYPTSFAEPCITACNDPDFRRASAQTNRKYPVQVKQGKPAVRQRLLMSHRAPLQVVGK